MRNSRGEWNYRESYDAENFKFIRNSGIQDWEIEDTRKNFWSEVAWLGIALVFTILFASALGFGLSLLMGV